MDLDQIRCFLSVAELQSFSAAARRHFITQPAVSQRLKALETSLGARLVERRGRRITLTEAGRLFQRRGLEALAALERGAGEVGETLGLQRGRLSIGAIDAAGVHLLPGPLKTFHRRWPGVEVDVQVAPSGTLLDLLQAGRLDLAVVVLPVTRTGLNVRHLEDEDLVLVLPPGQPATRAARALETFPLIAYPRGSVTRGLIDRELAGRGLTPRVAMELGYPEAIRGLVEAGLGAAILPERVVARGRTGLTRVAGFRLRRGLGLVHRAGEDPSGAARAFAGLLKPRRPGRPRPV